MTKRKKVVFDVPKEKLVAVHFRNGLGNFIMMTPAIKALAEMYDAKIDLILDKGWTDSRRESVEGFCQGWELINRVYDFQEGFDKSKYIQLFYSRFGEDCETSKYFQDHAGYDAARINWRSEKLNEVELYMNDVYELGYKGVIPDQHCIPGSGAKSISKISSPSLANNFRVGLCNGFFAGSPQWKWERKGWPHFSELVGLLKKYYGINLKVYLFGKGKAEKEWANGLKEKYDFVSNFVDRFHIAATIRMMKHTNLFITTDTGLMHIADAARIPMVVLFGPTLVSKNGPYNDEYRIARTPLKCAPCQQSPLSLTCNEWRCMKELTPSMVMSTVRRYMQDLMTREKIMTKKIDGEIKPCLLDVNWIRADSNY